MKVYSMRCGTVALLFLAFIVSGCGALNKDVFDKDIFDKSFNTLQESAAQYMDTGKHEETVYITCALLDAEPDNRQVQMLQEQALAAQPASSILMKKSILGSNLTDRVVNEGFPWWGRVLLYAPNRVFDLLDLITLEVGYCFGIGVKAQVTDFTSIGAQLSAGSGVVGLNRRHLSVRAGQEEFFHFLPFGAILLAEVRASSGSNYSLAMYDAGIKFPSDLIYQNARDFWAIGAEAQAVVLAANVQLHPIEFYDFICGFVFYDPLKDDLGSTRPINTNLWLKDIQALKDLTYQTRLR